MILTTVRISSPNMVGSGVILRRMRTDQGKWLTTILTAQHVVTNAMTDLQGSLKTDPKAKLMVELVSETGVELGWWEAQPHFAADLAQFFKGKRTPVMQRCIEFDLGLLDVLSDEPFGNVVKLPTRSRAGFLPVRSRVHLVGFPLGFGPYHTEGELGPVFELSKRPLRLISAPGISGNSGGGIFSDETHELWGIFSKVMSYGQGLVTHMGLLVPISDIYYWFHFVGRSQWIPKDEPLTATDARAALSNGPIRGPHLPE